MSPLKHVHMDTSGLQTAHVVPEKQELKITVYSLPYYYRYLCNKDSPLFPLCVLKTFCCISLSFKKKIYAYILINLRGRHCQKNWIGCAANILKPIACFIPKLCDFPYPVADSIQNVNILFSELNISLKKTYPVHTKQNHFKTRVCKPCLISNQNG